MSDTSLPQHIAIIMDGNRRWAKQHQLQALQGHAQVANQVIEPLTDRCIELGVKYLTLWAFSTENWGREKDEVAGLMNLFRDSFKKSASLLHKKGIRLETVGDMSAFPEDIQTSVAEWKAVSAENTNLTVIFALNYGGRDEIVRATRAAVAAGEELTEATINKHMDGANWPEPDLIIRPGGELRLSGFLAWSGVYSELYFTPVLMPDFSPAELDKAIAEYQRRQRRFGK